MPSCSICHGTLERFAHVLTTSRPGMVEYLRARDCWLSEISIWKCSDCGVRQHFPLLPHSTYLGWYAAPGYSFERAGRSARPFSAAIKHALEIVDLVGDGPGHVLEIGPGVGALAALLYEMDWSIACVDASVKYADRLRKAGVAEVTEGDFLTADLPLQRFDWIIATDVFEHFSVPTDFLRKASLCLAPGGRLLLEVPNAGSLYSSIRGPNWFYGFEHPWSWTPKSLEMLLRQEGWRIRGYDARVSASVPLSEVLTRLGLSNPERLWGYNDSGPLPHSLIKAAHARPVKYGDRMLQKRNWRISRLGDQLRLVAERCSGEVERQQIARPAGFL